MCAATVWPTEIPTEMKAYGGALLELATSDPRVMCIGADLTGPTETDAFRDALPDRFVNVGMAEANAVGIAGGMARCGLVPFVNTFGVFATRRAFDQIAMQAAYPQTNVKLVGFMPGLTTPGGITHQAIEDIALMRALPGMTVIEPADAREIRASVAAVADHDGPVYLRIKRGEVPTAASSGGQSAFQIGRAQEVRSGSNGVIFACGLMVSLAIAAAERLATDGLDFAVVNAHTLKPLDVSTVIEYTATRTRVVTAENHSIIGGLGSAVAEAIAEAGVSCSFRRVGIKDTFAEGASAAYLFEKYGLSTTAIYHAARGLIAEPAAGTGSVPR